MKRLAILLFAGVTIVAMSGCSTWRCRGFVNVKERPTSRPIGNYKIASVRFVDIPSNPDAQKPYRQLVRISRQDVAPYAPYREDLAKFIGFTNETAGAVSLNIIIAPALQSSEGWKTVCWPLCGTLGVIPAHFSDKMPFEVTVEFGDVSSRPIQAMVCTDRQYGLSRYDMDMPPQVGGASAEIRDDGTVGTGSELRDVHQREVFVRTVGDAILQVIAEREKSKFNAVPTPYTEFGPVLFPAQIKSEVKPEVVKPVEIKKGPTQEEIAREKARQAKAEADRKLAEAEAEAKAKRARQEKKDAFAYPRDAEEKKLKALVLSGFLDKEAWWKRVAEHRAKIGQ